MTPREILLRARARVERGWTQEAFARKASGVSTHPAHEDACSWCLEGATFQLTRIDHLAAARDALRDVVGTTDLALWNDTSERTKEEVLVAIDAALAKFPEDASIPPSS